MRSQLTAGDRHGVARIHARPEIGMVSPEPGMVSPEPRPKIGMVSPEPRMVGDRYGVPGTPEKRHSGIMPSSDAHDSPESSGEFNDDCGV